MLFDTLSQQNIRCQRLISNSRNNRFTMFRYFIFLLLFLPMLSNAEDVRNLYFYSNESTVSSYKSLKAEFDGYLKQKGDYQFQPFDNQETFEDFVKDKQDGVFVVSHWHYEHLSSEQRLVPLLVGISAGKTAVRRILVGSHDADDTDLQGVVATAFTPEAGRAMLTQILGEQAQALELLQVPKDIDALMSVGFGMADYALSTEEGLAHVAKLNPSFQAQMGITAQGEKTLLLIAAAPAKVSSKAQALTKVMQNMGEAPNGKQGMRMLGLDGWQKPSKTDMQLLRGKH